MLKRQTSHVILAQRVAVIKQQNSFFLLVALRITCINTLVHLDPDRCECDQLSDQNIVQASSVGPLSLVCFML